VHAHQAAWYNRDAEEWLRAVTGARFRTSQGFERLVKEISPRLKTISFRGRVVSRAALVDLSDVRDSVDWTLLGRLTHGGLSSNDAGNLLMDELPFVGVIESEPTTATRFNEPGRSARLLADAEALSNWLEFQRQFLGQPEKIDLAALSYLAGLGGVRSVTLKHCLLRRFDLAANPKKIEDLPLVGFEAVRSASGKNAEFQFLTFEESIVFFVYYAEDEVKALVELMQSAGLTTLYFSPIKDNQINAIPQPGDAESRQCLLSMLQVFFEHAGYKVEVKATAFLPTIKPPFYTDGLLTFSATRS